MQVATLFRETATLLGASMEASEGSSIKLGVYNEGNGLNKQEPNDDGYETSSGGEFDGRGMNQGPPPPLPPLRSVLPPPHQPHPPPEHHHQHHPRHLLMKFDSPPPHQQAHQPPPQQQQQQPQQQQPPPQHHHPHHPHHHHNHHTQNHHSHTHHSHRNDDPYSFVDEEQHSSSMTPFNFSSSVTTHMPKKRGRKKKIKMDEHNGMCCPSGMDGFSNPLRPLVPKLKERKKHDRFNGMSEDEVSKRKLPDHLAKNLDIVIIGINPGLFAAYKGHHYAGPGNHFWKCLYLSGLTPEPMTADDDYKLLKDGIGFTNMVERATKGSADLTRKEIKEGSQILLEKLQQFRPKIAVFNGKLIFEVFSGKKDFSFGRQPELVDGTNTYMWVMPSSSARCAQLPRAADKVPFYAALKKFRDYLNGKVSDLDEKEIIFSSAKYKNLFENMDSKEETDFDGFKYKKPRPGISAMKPDDGLGLPKKKRGRPKKIKIEGAPGAVPPPMVEEQMKPKIDERTGIPKKKRGRPKKIKLDSDHNVNEMNNAQQEPCFPSQIHSPPVHGFPVYQHPQYNQNSQSPLPSTYHQSPNQSHCYSQSPQQPSFTHSDLSSEISAAISSERNPESPAIGPPDFDPPGNIPEDSKSPNQTEDYSSPQSKKKYSYDEFSTDSDSVRYPPKQINEDVSSKSLSGLESLVDQIPNIADGEHPPASVDQENVDHQFNEDSTYMAGYPRATQFTAPYNASSSNGYNMPSNNFSVTSLANSSVNESNNFSVTSLASNYSPQSSTYHNIMGPPPMGSIIDSSSHLFSNPLDRTCRIDPSNMSNGNSIPYPYSQYPSPYNANGFYTPPIPNPSFAYPPYSNTYPQTPPTYYPNPMFDRIKHPDRMDLGFGGF